MFSLNMFYIHKNIISENVQNNTKMHSIKQLKNKYKKYK